MPFKWETEFDKRFKLQGTKLDRRRHLTDEQKDAIRKDTVTSCNKLAKQYGVTKRTIQFIRNPESLAECIKRRQERGGSKIYYNREQHTKQMREYRKRKQQIYVLGELGCLPTEFMKSSNESQETTDSNLQTTHTTLQSSEQE